MKVPSISGSQNDTSYCICSHGFGHHVVEEGPKHLNVVCFGTPSCYCQEFKLDNLMTIEKLAEQRGLV